MGASGPPAAPAADAGRPPALYAFCAPPALAAGARPPPRLAGLPPDAWLALVLSPAAEGWRGPLRRPDDLARALDGDAVLVVLAPADREAGLASLGPVADALAGAARGFVALVARRAPPADDYRYDGAVGSFACTARLLRARPGELARPEGLCYRTLRRALAGPAPLDRLLARQIPLSPAAAAALARPAAARAPAAERAAVIVPHRGPAPLLAAALRSTAQIWGRPRVLVGLDSRGVAAYRALAGRDPRATFFRSEPAPLGPYAVRHALALRAREPFLLFQDSDDASCCDRLALLLRRAAGPGGAGVVGSHELRLDELTGRVTATRFPLDAGAALRARPHHPMLLPTTLVRRRDYLAAGGFSTDRAFAYDTQFVFRSSFSLDLRNVDEFLYVRRRREGSLTTSPATGLGTPARVAMLASWVRDYPAVAAGALPLELSSLRPSPRPSPYRLVPLSAGARPTAREAPWVRGA